MSFLSYFIRQRLFVELSLLKVYFTQDKRTNDVFQTPRHHLPSVHFVMIKQIGPTNEALILTKSNLLGLPQLLEDWPRAIFYYYYSENVRKTIFFCSQIGPVKSSESTQNKYISEQSSSITGVSFQLLHSAQNQDSSQTDSNTN